MAEEVGNRFKVSRLFKRKKTECKQNSDKSKKKKFFDKNGQFIQFFNRFKEKNKVEDEKILVKEEENEVYIIPDPIEEKAAKKAKKKEKRKKRMKRIQKIALRSCHYIGMGVANMAPTVIYPSPNMEDVYGSYSCNDYRYYNSRQTHWTAGIVFANW